jgi:hypothetical protein
MRLCAQIAGYDGTLKVTNGRGEGGDLRSAGALRALPITGGNGSRLLTRQLRYRLRHASNGGKANPIWN